MSVRIKELIYKEKSYTDPNLIDKLLLKKGFHWLQIPEIENAILEIKDNKLYWNSGIWYYGDFGYGIWLDGIFKFGTFNGVWNNGVFKDGIFNGIWINGTFESGDFKGEWRGGIRKDKVSENVLKFCNFIKNN